MPPFRFGDEPDAAKSDMQKNFSNESVETFGAPVFALCDAQAAVTLEHGTDLDRYTYDAVFSIMRGESWETVQAHLTDCSTHPAAARLEAELLALHRLGWQN